ncbi:dihydrolipoyl dehydrogenase [Corynebacterium variabile]|uniref:dihydrolipoyl dehydrogenase n=1 Tax=Corynebacterium variabile TaxID=1727 RepID=UPI002FE16557
MTTNNRARTPLQQKADRFDVIVVGAGPGGYVAAIRAAQHGLRVAVVERGELGGVCSNVGCIPTKAMLHGADVAHEIATAGALGFSVGEVSFDISGLVDHSRQVVDQLTTGIRGLLDANGVEIIVGNATVPQKGRVKVEVAKSFRELHSDHIILATGARPRSIPGVEPDGDHVWTSTEALRPSSLPASLLIIGSGAIGAEFASLYRDLGTEVTLVEALPGILPAEDAEVSAFVAKQFLARGIDVRTSVTVVSVVPDPSEETGGVTTTFTTSDGASHSVVTERVLVATGVTPNSEGLGLESLGAKLERGFVKTDQWCRTGVAGLYAIGDLAGGPCLAHKASHEAVLCVDHIVGEAGVKPLDRDFVPGCTYSRPQVASIGLTEAQARERVGAAGGGAGVGGVRVGKFNLVGNGKALALGEPEGFVKTVFDGATGELLGAHLVGPAVTEMVQGFGVAHSLRATAEDLAEVVFPHPTVSEAMHESVLDALDRVIHWPPARR